MKKTKKQIIKKLLADELRSEAQIQRLKSDKDLGDTLAINWDLHSATDDEIIEYACKMRDEAKQYDMFNNAHFSHFFNGVNNGHEEHQMLTPKAYLLLMAYNGSCSTLRKYSEYYDKSYTALLNNVVKRHGWRLEYKDLCEKLHRDINETYDKANSVK